MSTGKGRGREVLLYLAIKHHGEWESILNALEKKEYIDEEELQRVISVNRANYVTIIDDDYPEDLKKIYKPPFILFYYGNYDLLRLPRLAVVGSRKCTEYGKKSVKKVIQELQSQLVIVSGLAKGIDATAHLTAIETKAPTMAILGSGIDLCYPKENQKIYDYIKENGLLISEYPLDTAPNQYHFPTRNRLIAALSKATLVVEASEKSGTAYTIQAALEFGKDILCIPHSIFNEHHYTNRLIREGATLIEKGQDILEEFKLE